MNRPKAIGTAAESAVVKYLRANGFPHAERRALAGSHDLGDVTGCPGLVFEVKGGTAAKTASDGQVAAWMRETEAERVNARADLGVLVLARAGYGPERAGAWWVVAPLGVILGSHPYGQPVRLHLCTFVRLLRARGYGAPLYEDAS